MTRADQHTIATPIAARGDTPEGRCSLKLQPAPPETGLCLVRRDLPGHPHQPCRLSEARWDPSRGLLVGEGACETAGLTPLLAVCQALEVDNLFIELDAPCLPRFDGSSAPYVFLLQGAGRVRQDRPACRPSLSSSVVFRHPVGRLHHDPSGGPWLGVADGPSRWFALHLSPDVFATQLARARAGCGEGARWPDEALRYTLVEALAVLALVGGRFVGRLRWTRAALSLHLDFWHGVLSSATPDGVRWRCRLP